MKIDGLFLFFDRSWWPSKLSHALFQIVNIIIIVLGVFVMFGEWITNLLEKPRSISPHSRIGAFKFVKCTRISSTCQLIVAVYPIVLLHHKYLRVHLRLFKGFTSHFSLKVGCGCGIYPLYMRKSCLNLLLLKFSLVLHKIFSLIMKEQVPLVDHIQFLLG